MHVLCINQIKASNFATIYARIGKWLTRICTVCFDRLLVNCSIRASIHDSCLTENLQYGGLQYASSLHYITLKLSVWKLQDERDSKSTSPILWIKEIGKTFVLDAMPLYLTQFSLIEPIKYNHGGPKYISTKNITLFMLQETHELYQNILSLYVSVMFIVIIGKYRCCLLMYF